MKPEDNGTLNHEPHETHEKIEINELLRMPPQ